MRSLRVLGIAASGDHLVCAEVDRPEPTDTAGEPFALPLDERLRAAVRGDLTRFGQLEIDMAPQLRPREIQSRIRAGASIEQVAAAAGCAPDRIERYAYPVLMERRTVADRARAVRPLAGAAMGSTGAARADRTLEDIVTATLADRGQQQDLTWDAFRDERGWTATVTWRAGRSENRAEWAYHAGPDGGSVTARNDAATDLVEPAPRPLRTIGDGQHGSDTRRSGGERRSGDGHRNGEGQRAGDGQRGGDGQRTHRPAEPDRESVVSAGPTGEPSDRLRRADRGVAEYLVASTVTDDRSGALPPTRVSAGAEPDDGQPARTGTDGPAGDPEPDRESGPDSGRRPATSRTAKRGHRPPMPSWEDVLLGTRASGR